MRVLIAGGGGQLGRELLATVPDGIEAAAPSRSELDLERPDSIRRAVAEGRPEVTINAAAYTAVDRAEAEPERAMAVNATGAGLLAAATAELGGRLIHLSTDFVFDGALSRPYRPDDAPRPLSAYGRSKLAGEAAVRTAAGDRALVVRTAWLYSCFGANFVRTVLELLRRRPAVDVVADQSGSPTWARRLALALWALCRRPRLGGILHCADDGVASRHELAEAVRDLALELGLLERRTPVRPVSSGDFGAAAPRPEASPLDSAATWSELGLEQWPWRRSLQAMLTELRDRRRS